MGNVRLSLADQVLVWSAFALAGPYREPEDAKMFSAIIADILPHVSRANPYVEKIALAAAAVIHGGPATDVLELSVALKAFARWRAGLSYDAFAAKTEGNAA